MGVLATSVSNAFLTYLFLTSFAIAADADANAGDSDFDFYYLVQQWPGSYCDTQQSCCYPTTGKPASNFSLHGLWPNNVDGSYPSNCDSSETFDESQVEDLLPQLQKEWPTLSCPSSDGQEFWGHEWLKHGTCSHLRLHEYFQDALTLHDSLDTLGALESASIRPDDGAYSVTGVQNALRSALGGADVGVQCNSDSSGNPQLFQIYLCVGKNDLSKFISCPTLPDSRCSGDSVQFPSF